MVNSVSAYRVYANTLSSIEYLPYAKLDEELQIVLPFARDYDATGRNRTGEFEVYVDRTQFNATAIQDIRDKASYTSVKFFLSIGGRNPIFPFAVTSADQTTWITNATKSLKQIAKDYGFDGIDVYYKYINSNAESQFADSIFEVISDLKRFGDISMASIIITSRLNNKYHDLFTKNDKRFEYVVYQTHNEPSRIPNAKDLQPVFDGLRYPKPRILVGHSDVPSDWATVIPPVFLGAVPDFLTKGVSGFSKWMVDPSGYNPEP